jgi:hypothetical protein
MIPSVGMLSMLVIHGLLILITSKRMNDFSKKITNNNIVNNNNNNNNPDEEYSIYSFFEKQANSNRMQTSSSLKEKEQLYEAYNLLHTLAQDFHKPFDAPAVIVVGHQTSGKSALIEALMGFQFNQVRSSHCSLASMIIHFELVIQLIIKCVVFIE